jgi:arginase
MERKNIELIGACIGIAAGNSGCVNGPEVFINHENLQSLDQLGIHPQLRGMLYIDPQFEDKTLDAVCEFNQRLADVTQSCAQANETFITIGGDHSLAIGSWSGAYQECKPLGLIWIDAHMDSHTMETSPSGNIHGMPLASLLGYGDPKLTGISSDGPKIRPENLTLIGIRSYEPEEKELLEGLGVKIYYMNDIESTSIGEIKRTALARARNGTSGFGISVDLDAIDPSRITGVGTPVNNGLYRREVDELIMGLGRHPEFIGADIVEYNPKLDKTCTTQDYISECIISLFNS